MVHELWECRNSLCFTAIISRDGTNPLPHDPDDWVVWRIDAVTCNQAMDMYYAEMQWGKYKRFLLDGEETGNDPYTEAEERRSAELLRLFPDPPVSNAPPGRDGPTI